MHTLKFQYLKENLVQVTKTNGNYCFSQKAPASYWLTPCPGQGGREPLIPSVLFYFVPPVFYHSLCVSKHDSHNLFSLTCSVFATQTYIHLTCKEWGLYTKGWIVENYHCFMLPWSILNLSLTFSLPQATLNPDIISHLHLLQVPQCGQLRYLPYRGASNYLTLAYTVRAYLSYSYTLVDCTSLVQEPVSVQVGSRGSCSCLL